MGVKLLLSHFAEKIKTEESIDFIKLAQSAAVTKKDGTGPKMVLVVDGESCLDRLYGGFFSDWICGGQWNRMETFIRDLVSKMSQAGIELVVFFNGAIEPQRLPEWIKNQKDEFYRLNRVLQEVEQQRAPPKWKFLWTAPVGLRGAIRMKLRQLNVNVVCTSDDHRQEVIAYCRENSIFGLIADDAEYLAFQPPRLFSASSLKLRYRGVLESKEFKIEDFMSEYGLSSAHVCVLAALLGNFILSDKELRNVYDRVGVQMVIPDKKTYEVFAPDTVPKLAQFVSKLNMSLELDDVIGQIFEAENDPRAARLKQSIQYYLNGTKDGFQTYRSVPVAKEVAKAAPSEAELVEEADIDTGRFEADNALMNKEFNVALKVENELNNIAPLTKGDLKTEQANGVGAVPPPVLPQVSHEVMRTLSERHNKGLMTPYIYQILSHGEIKLPVIMQNLYNTEDMPNIYAFYKPIRQMVYGIVFNLYHHTFTATKEKKPVQVDIRIKEWVFNMSEKIHKAEYVRAISARWGVPTIQRLWFGTLQEDKRRRLRAFLTCMRSDVQQILNPDYVPQEVLMAAVVLRYIMSFPEKPILRKQELDAFIVTALTMESSDMNTLQELNDPISPRNVQLAVLFMKGVEMALLANDACGAPVPWLMCCPWLFFDGKLFNHMFQRAITCKNLQELCDGRLGYVVRAERMRQAILEGLCFQFARPPGSQSPFADLTNPGHFRGQQLPPPPCLGRSSMNDGVTRGPGGPPRNLNDGFRGTQGPRSLGGSLKVAGVVTGSWGANYTMSSQPPYDGYLPSTSQVPASNSFNSYGYRSRAAYTPGSKGKSFKFYPGKSNDVKRKPAYRGGGRGGRARGGMTVGNSTRLNSLSNAVAAMGIDDLPNGNDLNPTDDSKLESTAVNGAAAASSSNVENDDNSNVVKRTNDESSSVDEGVGAESVVSNND